MRQSRRDGCSSVCSAVEPCIVRGGTFKVQQRVPKTSCDMEAYRAPVRASAKSNAGAGFDTVVPVGSHAVENIPCLQILMVSIIIIIIFELLQ